MRSNEKIRELKKIKKYNISETISSLTILESFSATYHKSGTASH